MTNRSPPRSHPPGLTHDTLPADLEAATERQPLLPPPVKPTSTPTTSTASPSPTPTPTLTVTTPALDEADPDIDDDALALLSRPRRTRSKIRIAWYVVLVLVSAFVLGVFVKGWIEAKDVEFDLGAALRKALGGGLSGAAAMVLQVLLLMPLRTVMNFQYRFGMTTTLAIKTLYADGGYGRYYQGLGAALIQGPVSRFGDTAANAGILALLQSNTYMKRLPIFIKTVFASLAAAAFRMVPTPVDTLKTTLQAQGRPGWEILKRRIKQYGVTTLWYGAFATAGATFVGHYPWFATYNTLDGHLPKPDTLLQELARQAFIGFVASIASDTVSNSLRVVKTYRQVNEERVEYSEAARRVIAQDGLLGLFGRGLKTRILANGLQGLMFSVLWKLFLNLWDEKTKNSDV